MLDAGREAYERADVAQLREAISELDTFRSTAEACRVSEELTDLLDTLEPHSGERYEHEGQTCRTCAKATHDREVFYCGTCSPTLWGRIEKEVGQIIAATARKPYVGRTAFPERRLLQHLVERQRDRLSILHWADSLEEAETFERGIFELVRQGAETDQKEPRMQGKFSRGHHAIYVSWNSGSSSTAREQRSEFLVTTLPGQRNWPVSASTFEAKHLISPLHPYQAKRVLDLFDAREADYLEKRRAER
jgi:hypothetical protein